MLQALTAGLNIVGEYTLLLVHVIAVTLRRPPQFYLIRDQLYKIGVTSLPVVAITGFSTGLVLAAQSFYQLSDKGLEGATGLMVGKSMFAEMGPVLTAFMVTGRVGAAICAELGTMRVSEQIDALKSMGVNPLRYLVAPRFLAGIFVMPLLTVFSCLMGILGGYLISVYLYGMSPIQFFDPMIQHVSHFDFISGMCKAFIFGILIVTICCFMGLRTHGGAEGVGRYTTSSVVACYTFILFANFIATLTLNTLHTTWKAM